MSNSDKNKDRKPSRGKSSEGKFTFTRKPGKSSANTDKSDSKPAKGAGRPERSGGKPERSGSKPERGGGKPKSGKGDFSKFIKQKSVRREDAEQEEQRDFKGKKGDRKFSKDRPYKDQPYKDRPYEKREGGFKPGDKGKRFGFKKPEPELPTPESIGDGGMRLNKYLAHAGIASRRKADELIAQGLVEVNGKVVLEMGFKVQEKDKVTFKGKRIDREKQFVYVLLNKPKNFITTTKDEKDRDTVMSLVKNASEQRIYPVGRLDRNTTGLLLFTNDGDLAQKMTHPSHGVKKIYHVVLNKALTEEDMEAIARGVTLEDGDARVDNIAYTDPKDLTQIGVDIHIGKNRIVRRIFEQLGYEVVKLDRVYFGGLTKKDLPRGKWRFLDPKEVIMLKHFNKKKK